MTITDINKMLERLAEQPTRENILNLSFALLQWMNIEPNPAEGGRNKPQLLSPQTQKLKDFLATAPQTVQPQLYRISADNQNIRVRFAVLKKLKKEYISQLVDNDPGLSSYQSFIKGLTSQNGTGFIPTQPYFIHFVTTPEYDKLVLIFNQGEQKRIVSFRNRLTNTQYNKIIQLWQGIGTKSKPEIAGLLWKSLDIKEVNKEFYKQIKERFDALINILSEPEFSGLNDNNIQNIKKQFAVRFLGRYIFCWFLKEKDGIIPQSLISSHEIKKFKEAGKSFYHERLLKLFFGTLNTLVSNRNWLKAEPADTKSRFEKIPYLNGGLFDDNNPEDQLFNSLQFNINDWLINFVEILESYDFTIDESSSQYQQVAVDPEMLGRIFENLLASQNEETEKIANQRKAFGAFYTPREIVDYMVNESIKAYLQTQWEQNVIEEKTKNLNNQASSADLFGNKKPQQLKLETSKYELRAEEKQKIEKALETLFTVNADGAHLKKDEKNLLDGFLKKIKVLDPACGSGAFPMGILHKLKELREYLGFYTDPYQLKLDILSNNIYGVDIMPMATEIARLRSWLSLILEADYKPNLPQNNFGVDALPNLDFKFVCANSLIDLGLDAFIADTSLPPLLTGFNKILISRLKDLENLRKQFFTPALISAEKEKLKVEYLSERDDVVKEIEQQSEPVLIDIAQKIKHWNPFDDSQPSPFFSPTWMFGIDSGFDVVIGNPPYVQMQKGIYSPDTFPFSEGKDKGKQNLYKVFVEASYNYLKKNGTASMIVQSSLLCDLSSTFTRELLLTKTELEKVLEYPKSASNSDAQVFDSVLQGTCTYIFTKKNPSQEHSVAISIHNDTSTITNPIFERINQLSLLKLYPDTNYIPLLLKGDSIVLNRISKNSVPLNKYLQSITQGDLNLTTSSNEFSDKKTEIKLYRGRNIHKYELLQGVEEYVSKDFRKEKVKENQKHTFIVLQEITGTTDKYRLHACLTDRNEKFLFGHTANKILLKDESLNPSCMALLTSKLLDRFFRKTSTNNHVMGYEIKQLPFPIELKSKQKQIEKLVDEILKKKKANHDTTSLEKEIDVLVCKLYELSYDEVKIIDKDFWLSAEEYEKIKM